MRNYIDDLSIRRLFSVLMNLAHLVRACHFKLSFLQSLLIYLSKVKIAINCYPKKIVIPRLIEFSKASTPFLMQWKSHGMLTIQRSVASAKQLWWCNSLLMINTALVMWCSVDDWCSVDGKLIAGTVMQSWC